MELMSLIVIFTVIVVGFAVVFFLLNSRLRELKDKSENSYLKTDIVELSRSITQLQQYMGERIDKNNESVQSSLARQLEESTKIVTEVSAKLAELDKTNQQVVNVAAELKTLQNILQNPKQRGVFGEYYLQNVLENVMSPSQYQMQYRFLDGEAVDAVIFLERGQVLPIDSKFSLENYNRMLNTADKIEREKLIIKVRGDLKARIDETSKYIRPSEGTMDFAFMFIPSEALYYHLLVGDVGKAGSARNLIEYAFRDKHVIIVSPTSFMAYLQTVLQGLRSLQIEEQAKDIQKRVGELGRHIGQFDIFMQKLGSSLSTTVNHYNTAHNELGKVDKDIMKISNSTTSVDPKVVDRPSIK